MKDLRASPRKKRKTYRFFSKAIFDRILQRREAHKSSKKVKTINEITSEKHSENENKNMILLVKIVKMKSKILIVKMKLKIKIIKIMKLIFN